MHHKANWYVLTHLASMKMRCKKDRKKEMINKISSNYPRSKNTLHYSYKKHISIDPEGDICWSPFKVWVLGFAKYRQFWPLIKIISKWILNFYSNSSPKLCTEATKILEFRKIKFVDSFAPLLKLWLVMFGPLRDQDWKPSITDYDSRVNKHINQALVWMLTWIESVRSRLSCRE